MTNTLETPTSEVGEEISGLVRKLNRTDGLSFVYEVLEVIAQRYRLDDAVIRLESALGEGFYRLRRAKVDPELASRVPTGPRVFFAEPDVVPPEVTETVLDLCVLALRLCIGRHSRHLDRRTGLLANHAFDRVLEASAAQAARHGWAYTIVVLDLGESNAESTVDDVRQFGKALHASLRSGDVGSRIAERRFAALLSNSDLDAVNPFLGRVYTQLGRERSNVELSLGAAAAPVDSVDPVELRRLAANRLQPGARDQSAGRAELTVSLWEYLELELRLLPAVVHVSRIGRRAEREVVGILTRESSPTVEASARRIVEAHGLDVDFEFDVLRAPGEPEEADDQEDRRSGASPGRSRIVYKSASMESPFVATVHLGHGARSAVGRSSAGELRGSAEATILALAELGVDAPLSLESVSSAKGEVNGSPVRVILADTGSDRRYVGIARGVTGAEAASRAALCALNGFLDGVHEKRSR
jgi:GGDEF domain-containing protein